MYPIPGNQPTTEKANDIDSLERISFCINWELVLEALYAKSPCQFHDESMKEIRLFNYKYFICE